MAAETAGFDLPDLVIQHIQSLLPTKSAATTTLLSKSWLRSWSSRPVLDFNQSHFGLREYQDLPRYEKLPKIKKFVDFVKNTMLNYRKEKLFIQKFRLHATVLDCKPSKTNDNNRLVDEWIRVALQSGVKELDLELTSFTLPRTILSSTSLVVLKLRGCTLQLKDEETIQSLMLSSKVIEAVHVVSCTGFEKLKVPNLDSLKIFQFTASKNQMLTEIEAPNLMLLKYRNHSSPVQNPCLSNLKFCRTLKDLHLGSKCVTDMFLRSLVTESTVLEAVTLMSCDELETINISSESLKFLTVSLCRKLVEVKIDGPNLRNLDYRGTSLPSMSFTNTPSHLEICVAVNCVGHVDAMWFLQLKRFLEKVNHLIQTFKVLIHGNISFTTEDLSQFQISDPSQENLQATKVETLKLRISDASDIVYRDMFTALLWSCQPKTLHIDWANHYYGDHNHGDFSDNSKKIFLMFLSEQLTHERDLKTYWWRYLKDAEILGSNNVLCNWQPLDLKALVEVSPTVLACQRFRFELRKHHHNITPARPTCRK